MEGKLIDFQTNLSLTHNISEAPLSSCRLFSIKGNIFLTFTYFQHQNNKKWAFFTWNVASNESPCIPQKLEIWIRTCKSTIFKYLTQLLEISFQFSMDRTSISVSFQCFISWYRQSSWEWFRTKWYKLKTSVVKMT